MPYIDGLPVSSETPFYQKLNTQQSTVDVYSNFLHQVHCLFRFHFELAESKQTLKVLLNWDEYG